MRLSDYFQQQKTQMMPSEMKSQIFSHIQKNKWIEFSTKLQSKFLFFASKRIMYTSLAAFLCVVVFGWMLLDRTHVIDFWTFSIQKNTNPNGVLADYVAEIIEFNGDYSLVRNGETIENSQAIWNGDDVTLADWTDIIFTLNDGTQAKIIWPANFSVIKNKKWYQLSLRDWKFFRIYCPECASDIEIVTPDAIIHQEKNQALDVHIAKDSKWRMLVKNDGDSVSVLRSDDKTKSETEIETTKLVAIVWNSDSMDVLNDSNLMAKFMDENNISSTFTISSKDVEDYPLDKVLTMNLSGEKVKSSQTKAQEKSENTWAIEQEILAEVEPEIEAISVQSLSDVEANKDKDILLAGILEVLSTDIVITWTVDDMSDELLSDLWLNDESPFQMPTQKQINSIKKNLNGFFLMNIFENIYTKNKPEKNIEKFADRINSVSEAFGYSDRADLDLESIQSLINTLESKLQDDWYISPSYILQLQKLSNRCDYLISQADNQWEDLQSQRDSFVSNLSISLRLM